MSLLLPGRYLQHLVSLLSPIYWTTATEVGEAVNGYTLTNGHFQRNVHVQFATGLSNILSLSLLAHFMSHLNSACDIVV